MKISLDKDTTQKLILGIVIYLVAFAVFDNMIMKKIKDKHKMDTQILASLESDYAMNLEKIAKIDEKKEEYNGVLKDYEKLKKFFIEISYRKKLLNEIEKIAKYYEISIISTDLDTSKEEYVKPNISEEEMYIVVSEEEKKYYTKFTMNMKLKASFENIVNFIETMENYDKLVNVEMINLQKNKENLDVTIILTGYIIENNS